MRVCYERPWRHVSNVPAIEKPERIGTLKTCRHNLLEQTLSKSGHFTPFTEILIEQTGYLAPAAATRDLPLATRSISEYIPIGDGHGATFP
jgi:hypothetical protein